MTTNTTNSILPGDLVSAEWLATNLGSPRLAILDIRGYVRTEDLGGGRQRASYESAADEFAEAHVPGSIFVDWTKDIVDPDGEVKAQIAPPERFAEAMGSRGVDGETDVVVVDHGGGHLATRLWWALRYYGHDRVAVLDGGFNRWQSLGLPLEAGTTTPERRTFTPAVRPGLWSGPDDVLQLITSGERQIVDARDADTFEGRVQRTSRGGHIPTAVNLSSRSLVEDDGRWKTPEEILSIAAAAGVDIDRPVTAYCNGGVTATATLFGLRLAGLEDMSNYDGSWNEWGERDDLPVEGNMDLFAGDSNGYSEDR